MAKYLRTSGISAGLEDLIRNAKERLYIISPYLKLSDNIKELLNDKEREKVEVRIIFGKQELNPGEMSYLENLKYVRLYFSKNLHAKCYLNEKQMIIASMNLYEFSQQNNREMGILIDRDNMEDNKVYEDAWKDIDSILNNSEDFAYIKAPTNSINSKGSAHSQDKTSIPKNSKSEIQKNNIGYCIRTGKEIPFNIEKPMAYEAWKQWSIKSDPDKPEKYCHFSGEPSKGETSYAKPILKKNWSKAKEKHGLK
jgi:phosphatidylserine/phosphatidylglycerophosphate/cardiolipin synthase-like enzyme